MMMYKSIFLTIAIVAISILSFDKAYCQDSLSTSYAVSTLYIMHKQEIVDKVRSVFPKTIKKRQKCLDISVSPRIEYCPVYNFFSDHIEEELLDRITGKDAAVTGEEFDRINRFESFDLPYLAQIVPLTDTYLMVRFSKLNSQYVVAEILDQRMNAGRYRYGRSVQILLFFGEDQTIQSHFMTARVYN